MDLLESRWQYSGDVPLSRFGGIQPLCSLTIKYVYLAVQLVDGTRFDGTITYTLDCNTMQWKKI